MIELLRLLGGVIIWQRRCLVLWLCLGLVSGCAANSTITDPLCPAVETPLTGTTEINVWAESTRGNCWYALAALTAVQRLPEKNRLNVQLSRGNKTDSIANANLLAQFQAGNGPDLVQATREQVVSWHESGYLTPLNDCVERHTEFEAIRKDLWPVVTIDDQIWAIPFDVDLTVLVYNKEMLRQLGWSAEEVSSFPYRVAQGDFLLPDLLDTAQTAVAKGVTEPGFGFWPVYSRFSELDGDYIAFGGRFAGGGDSTLLLNAAVLEDVFAFHKQLAAAGVMPPTVAGNAANNWSSRLVRRDAIAAGRVIFWQSDSDEIARLWHDFPDMPRQFKEKFGLAAFPTAVAGRPGSTILSYSVFVVPSEQATGRAGQAAACDLLVRMIDRDISARHSVTSFNVGAVTGLVNEPVFAQHSVLPKMEALLAYGHSVPASPAYVRLRAVLTAYMLRVESGDMEPESAVATAVAELQQIFGEQLVVEQ